MIYGRIPEETVLYRFTAQMPEGSKLSYNEVRSGRMHFRKVAKISHLHHAIAAKWVGGSLGTRTVIKKGKKKIEVVYNPGKLKVCEPVELWFVWRFKINNSEGHGRLKALDSGNCQSMSKGIEDGLVRCGMMGNDTNAFVTWVANLSLPMTKKEREALTNDEVELFICKTSLYGKKA
jgi:hypothetical protein